MRLALETRHDGPAEINRAKKRQPPQAARGGR
jgi:hypothetical protein